MRGKRDMKQEEREKRKNEREKIERGKMKKRKTIQQRKWCILFFFKGNKYDLLGDLSLG